MVAYWINVLSVVGGAFTILFLFWSITLLGRKVYGYNKISDVPKTRSLHSWAPRCWRTCLYFLRFILVLCCRAEVYSMSAFFTALVVWMVLKWDVIESETGDEAKANRWLILLFYMIGLSIGFHLLNLLSLPALGLIYYFKNIRPQHGVLSSRSPSVAHLVLFINDFIIPGLPSLAGWFELAFKNYLGLPLDRER